MIEEDFTITTTTSSSSSENVAHVTQLKTTFLTLAGLYAFTRLSRADCHLGVALCAAVGASRPHGQSGQRLLLEYLIGGRSRLLLLRVYSVNSVTIAIYYAVSEIIPSIFVIILFRKMPPRPAVTPTYRVNVGHRSTIEPDYFKKDGNGGSGVIITSGGGGDYSRDSRGSRGGHSQSGVV
ncbi:hypothetical protein PPL_01873 [Heterostelium album PN500]|uniref:THH1/TOM1/TOM3 domain-containing protein n=1 Tax=Heterostelium pallidum (strain ATCC 26659 / Pp 5 / PN500) TaxID=670386 RepID=D3B0Q6_HETP5|nr:hypothetical protein PPL_01873 [Heterostelium album PN500]EFA84880.1 hypothetical protein PPL_01873 [Heterostelium album PN500]|eukprot:XP_020436991.1 hypothetical protein PPL_01873 [Heterostelium album PN500]